MSRSTDLFESAIEMMEAAAAEARAEHAQSEARLHLLKAAHALEEIGDYEQAQRIIEEVRRMQEAAS